MWCPVFAFLDTTGMRNPEEYYTIEQATGCVVAKRLQPGDHVRIGRNGTAVHLHDSLDFDDDSWNPEIAANRILWVLLWFLMCNYMYLTKEKIQRYDYRSCYNRSKIFRSKCIRIYYRGQKAAWLKIWLWKKFSDCRSSETSKFGGKELEQLSSCTGHVPLSWDDQVSQTDVKVIQPGDRNVGSSDSVSFGTHDFSWFGF